MRYEQDKNIVERGHRIYVVSCKTFGAPSFEMAEGIEIYRVPAIALPVIEYPFPNLMILYSWVVELLRKNKIDIVHIEDGAFITSLLALLVKKLLKKPVVLSMQGFPGFSWFYGNPFVDWMAKIYTLTLGKTVLKTADMVVLSATAYVKDALKLGVPVSRIKVIPRGVDVRIYNPNTERRKAFREKLGLKNDETMILFAGRLVSVKGLKYFVEAAKTLLKENKKLKFVVAGDGILRGKYQREAWDFKANIRFIGYRRDMENVMNAADIFVLSSISEGCPNAVIEAGACAKPVVASDVGAVRDIVVNGVTGLIVQPRNVKDLHNAIREIATRLDKIQMGKKAMQFVTKRFAWETIASKYENVYLETLESQKGARIFH